MFSETLTLISNAQDEFLCSLPSSPSAFWAPLLETFLISVSKMDDISFPPPLSHKLSPSVAGSPSGVWSHDDWQKNQVV